jgi:hypothetical protein
VCLTSCATDNLPYSSIQGPQEPVQRQVVSRRQPNTTLFFLMVSFSGGEDDDGSLARPPMRLFGRVRSQHLFISEGDSGDESSDSDGIDSDGDKFGVQWSGGGFGGLTSEEEVVDEELVNGEPLN